MINSYSYEDITYEELFFYHTIAFQPDEKYPTLLMKAITLSNIQLAKALIINKIGIDFHNKYGDDACTLSILYGLPDILKLLLDNGININSRVCSRGNDNHNFLSLACKYGNENIVELVLKKGININHKSLKDNTSLIYASSNNFTNIVSRLIYAGANLDDINNDGNSALMLACKYDCEESALKLIAANADVNIINNDYENALILAARNGNKNIVKKLLEYGSNTSVKLPGCCGMLFSFCSINAKNEAIKYKHEDVSDIIKKYNEDKIIEMEKIN